VPHLRLGIHASPLTGLIEKYSQCSPASNGTRVVAVSIWKWFASELRAFIAEATVKAANGTESTLISREIGILSPEFHPLVTAVGDMQDVTGSKKQLARGIPSLKARILIKNGLSKRLFGHYFSMLIF
jgi:hypothetical protein